MNCSAPSATAKDLIGGEPGIGIFASRLYDFATGTVSAALKAQLLRNLRIMTMSSRPVFAGLRVLPEKCEAVFR